MGNLKKYSTLIKCECNNLDENLHYEKTVSVSCHFVPDHFILSPGTISAQPADKLRVLVLTDIEADPDDTQSLIRFLMYCNQWDVEGLIATTSIHQKNRVAPESILKILAAYQIVQPNLLKHESGYP